MAPKDLICLGRSLLPTALQRINLLAKFTTWSDAYCISAALEATVGDSRQATAVHGRLVKICDAPGGAFSLWNKLLKLYATCQPGRSAQKLFVEMPSRDAVSYNTMISACAHHIGDTQVAASLYKQMLLKDLKPDGITISGFLNACSSVKSPYFVEQVHAHVFHFGLCSNGFVGSMLVKGYERTRGLDESFRAFGDIKVPDRVCWNVIIDACACRGSKNHAIEIFSMMRRFCGEGFDSFGLTSVLKTCFDVEDGRLGVQLHCCGIKLGLQMQVPVANALITMYVRCEQSMASAVELFQAVAEPNIISWTSIISGFAQKKLSEEAISFYKHMLSAGLRENEFCFTSVLPAFSVSGSLENGRQVHCRVVKSVFQTDVEVGNALVDLYFKCGCPRDARKVFDAMKSHDVVSWTVMILGFGQHGKATEAIEVFELMRSRGFEPDSITFLAVLGTCSHGGLVDEGLLMFQTMIRLYGVMPRKEHYACVIDLLGRAGRLKDAERFIREMGLDMDPYAWEALLGACGMHGEVELGARSAEKVMELEPRKDAPLVLLSNMYAEQRMWEEKGRLRAKLDVTGLRKKTASSWFEP